MSESTNNKQIKAGAALGYVNYALKMIVQLLYVPIMLRILGQNEYGVYQLVASVIAYLGLLSFGFGGAYYRFYSQCRGDRDREATLNGTYLLVFLFFAAVAGTIGLLLAINTEWVLGSKLMANELSLARELMIILIISLMAAFPNSVFSSIIFSRECFVFLRVLEIVKTVLNPLGVIAVLLLGYGSVGLVWVSTVITVAATVIELWYVCRRIKAPFSFRRFDFRLVRDIAAFSVFLFLDAIIDQVNWNVDKLLLGRLVGAAAIAVYSVGAQINTIYIQVTDLLASVLAPRVNRIVASEKDPMPHLNSLFVQVGRIQVLIVFAVLCGFTIWGKEFVLLWAGDGYEEAYYVTLLLIAPMSIPLCQSLAVDIQRALNKHQFRSLVFALIAVVNLFLSIPLIRHFGAVGAAMGTTLALILGEVIIMNIMYHKFLGLNVVVFWKNIAQLIPTAIVPSIIGLIVKHFVPATSMVVLLAEAMLFVVIYALCIYFIGLNRTEKAEVDRLLKRHGSEGYG